MITSEPPTPPLQERMVDSTLHVERCHCLPCKSWLCLYFRCWHLTLLHRSRSSYQRPTVALYFLFLLVSFSLAQRKSLFLLSGFPFPVSGILTSTCQLARFCWINSHRSCCKHSHDKATIVNKVTTLNETERFSPKYTEISSLQLWKYDTLLVVTFSFI